MWRYAHSGVLQCVVVNSLAPPSVFITHMMFDSTDVSKAWRKLIICFSSIKEKQYLKYIKCKWCQFNPEALERERANETQRSWSIHTNTLHLLGLLFFTLMLTVVMWDQAIELSSCQTSGEGVCVYECVLRTMAQLSRPSEVSLLCPDLTHPLHNVYSFTSFSYLRSNFTSSEWEDTLCVYVYTPPHIYIHIYIYVCVCVYVYIYTCVCIYVCVYILKCVYLCLYKYLTFIYITYILLALLAGPETPECSLCY